MNDHSYYDSNNVNDIEVPALEKQMIKTLLLCPI